MTKIPAPPDSAPTGKSPPQGKLQRTLRRAAFACAVLMGCNLIFMGALLLFLHSERSGPVVARLTSSVVNALDTGIQLDVESIEFSWPLQLTARHVRLRDTDGPWLEVARVQAAIVPQSLVPDASLQWHVQASSALIQQGTWSRPPVLPPGPPEPAIDNTLAQPLVLLPAWLRVTAANLVLEDIKVYAAALGLAPAQPYIAPSYTLRLKAHGGLSATRGTLDVNAEIHPELADPPQADVPDALTRLNLSARWADNTLHLQTMVDDIALAWPHMQAHVPASVGAPAADTGTHPPAGLHVAGTITTRIPSVPPTPLFPLQVEWQLRLAAPALSPAHFSGQLRVDSEKLTWNKVALLYPASAPAGTAQQPLPAELQTPPLAQISPAATLRTEGSFNFVHGPVARLDVDMTDVTLLREWGLTVPQSSGPVQSTLRINADADSTQPYIQGEVHSPALTLPQGRIQGVSLKMMARVPATSSPPVPPHDAATPAHAVAQATPQATPPVAWALPTSFTGSLEAAVQSCMDFGPARLSTLWAVDDMAHTVGLRLAEVQGSMLGLKLTGKFASKGTRINDASLDLAMTDSTAVARLANIPLKGASTTLKVRFVPATAHKEYRVEGKLNMGAGSYDSVQWLSGEGNIQADSTTASLNLTVKGKLSARLRCSYVFQKALLRIDSMEVSESSKKIGASLQEPTELSFAKGISISNAAIAVRPAGSLHINGRLLPEILDVKVSASDLPVTLARAFTSAPLPHGTVSAQARLTGSPASPAGTLMVRVDNIPLAVKAGSPQASLQVDGTLARAALGKGSTHNLNLQARWEGVPGLSNFDGTAQIPLRFTPAPAPAMDAPVRAHVFWQGEVSPLWRLVPLPGRTLSGTGELQGQLAGTLNAPRVSGHVFLARGKFVDSVDGLVLDAITLEARYGEQGRSLLRLHATDGRGGTVDMDGSITTATAKLPRGQKVEETLAIRGTIAKLRPLRRDDVAVQLSGTLDITGPVRAPLIAGNICIDQGLIQLLNGFGGTNIKTLPIEEKRAPQAVKTVTEAKAKNGNKTANNSPSPVPDTIATAEHPRCDIRINAPGRVYIRGKGLDSEWKAALSITGPLDAPRILGNVTPIRGQLELLGHQFTMKSGGITFTGSTPPNPALDLTMQFKNADITALITFTGSAKQPKMRLSSQPVLPNDEIIAHILFGKNMNSLSRFEALQAANTARQLVDFGPSALDFMSSARDLLGLEVLRVGSSEATRQSRAPRDASLQGTSTANADEQGPTIEAGKYILDNVYVGIDQGTDAATGTAMRVEIELLPNLSIEGRTSNKSTGVGINWKHDY